MYLVYSFLNNHLLSLTGNIPDVFFSSITAALRRHGLSELAVLNKLKTDSSQENSMNSLGQDCNELKKRYEQCFNAWFVDGFLKGDTTDPCKLLLEEYQGCVKKAVNQHKINLWEVETDILGEEFKPEISRVGSSVPRSS